ncbi:hypothetical protein BDD12DRAFT_800495 [Trichophaea hybrida]|nr:hypothetical protein BDD12DRAFT_800495 [Trichophaea hybrida]
MSKQGHYVFSPHFSYMQNLLTSNATNLPPSCDEELADEADEPPDERISYFPSRTSSLSDEEFTKHSFYNHPPPKESLLTRALLTSPALGPIVVPNFERSMSNSSIWSNTSGASTVDLTSDAGMTGSSRANTPSPPPPMYLSQIAGILQGNKPGDEPKRVEIMADKDVPTEIPGRKRCITFACSAGPSRRGSQDDVVPRTEEDKKHSAEPVAPKKCSALTFMCARREESEKPSVNSMGLPPKHIDFAQTFRPEPRIAATAAATEVKPVAVAPKIVYQEPRKLYDSESAADSWTNQPIDKTRLLRVDDVLRKEKDIRKLSEEAEAEALQEEGEDEDEDDVLDDDGADEDDQDDYSEEFQDDEDDEDEDDYDGESGNETDNEEGFASDDDSDDEGFFGLHPPMMPPRPVPFLASSPRQIRSSTPELPDSTDFVCGTFDEDKPLEQAYLSCLEERKRSKHKATPQDIDPSFPTSESEDSDGEPEPRHIAKVNRDDSSSDGNQSRGRRAQSGAATAHSPPRGRVHSPAPVRRTGLAHSPAPSRRIPSPAPPSRRGSRVLSPAPPVRRRTHFQTGGNIVRSRSLPRNPRFAHRGKSFKIHSDAASPQKATRPVFIRRGAMDIVKGLEKKRERRKARFGRKDRDELWKAGEGVEKMRELGLEICGKGRARPIWVISA